MCGRLVDSALDAWGKKLRKLRSLELFGPFLVRVEAWHRFFKNAGPRLQSFKIRTPRFDLECVEKMVKCCPNITQLGLAQIGKLDDKMHRPLGAYTSLTYLDISDPGVSGPGIMAESLKDESVITLLSKVGANLRTPNISGNTALTDAVMTNCIAPHRPALISLSCSGCDQINGRAFAHLWNGTTPEDDEEDHKGGGGSPSSASGKRTSGHKAPFDTARLRRINLSRALLVDDGAIIALMQHSVNALVDINLNFGRSHDWTGAQCHGSERSWGAGAGHDNSETILANQTPATGAQQASAPVVTAMDPETALVAGIAPKKFMQVGEEDEVWGSGSKPYLMTRLDLLEAKHTSQNLQAPEKYETARISLTGGAPASPAESSTKRKAPSSSASSSSPTKKSKETLDGVRAWWNGHVLRSRRGDIFEAPTYFEEMLPIDMQLDGELWIARDCFDRTSGIVRSAAPTKTSEWKNVAFMAFDIIGDNDPVEQRWTKLKKKFGPPLSPSDALVKGVGATIVVLKQERCESKAHLEEELTKVEVIGGEGIMLRKPNSKYEYKRSNNLLKVKTVYDAEAVVIAHDAGEGKNFGRMGALRCRMESGAVFNVDTGFKPRDRENPPEIGAVVNYKFHGLTMEGTPRFPVYVGVAADKTEAKDADVRSTALRADKKAGSSRDL
ncbi:hypothetical protein OC846_006555 [Tilletia horrida]|uniref:ATP-dependent DNA ligase family profile domain-containing protein n=1 Tax=Tilletia horrida TaxID=155126 RepID=A0AAN6JUY9_9BASI|nr:hypothetical protein OC846_006555 [Tilletia horrida]